VNYGPCLFAISAMKCHGATILHKLVREKSFAAICHCHYLITLIWAWIIHTSQLLILYFTSLIFFITCCFWYRGYNYFWMVYLIICRVQLKLVIMLSSNLRMRKRYNIQRNSWMRLFELLERKLIPAFVIYNQVNTLKSIVKYLYYSDK